MTGPVNNLFNMFSYILLAIILIVLGTAAYAGLSAAPWLPTKPKQTHRLMEHLPLLDGSLVYDLGCGTGTLIFAAAKKSSKIKAVGLEISILPFFVAKIRSWFNRPRNVSVHFADLFQRDLHDADIVLVFLLSKSYQKLWRKFARELKDDALVILEAWPFPDLEPEKTIREENLLPIFFYRGHQFR